MNGERVGNIAYGRRLAADGVHVEEHPGERAVTLATKNPQTFTLIEADGNAEANALAVLDFQMPSANPVYRALTVDSLFGEVTGKPRP